ncbi:hypothetical protein TURU_004408 [Turdus rufiventris]|nr:hypothetical protein TURU_004408 [Turdus rufiventris]
MVDDVKEQNVIQEEAVREVLRIDIHKSMGPDRINPRVMRELADEFAVKLLSIIYQQSWLTGTWPMFVSFLAAEVEAAAPGERELILISAPATSPSCSQAQLDLAQQKSCESVSQAFLEMKGSIQAEEQTEPEQSMAPEGEAAAPGKRELVPIFSRNSPGYIPSPFPSPLQVHTLSEQLEEAERGSVLVEHDREEGLLAGMLKLSKCKYKSPSCSKETPVAMSKPAVSKNCPS